MATETKSFLVRLPLQTYQGLKEEADTKQLSMNSIVVDAIEAHLALPEEEVVARALYENSRAFATGFISSYASATGDSSFDLALAALAGPLPQEKQDDLQEEDSGD